MHWQFGTVAKTAFRHENHVHHVL